MLKFRLCVPTAHFEMFVFFCIIASVKISSLNDIHLAIHLMGLCMKEDKDTLQMPMLNSF